MYDLSWQLFDLSIIEIIRDSMNAHKQAKPKIRLENPKLKTAKQVETKH